MLRHMCILRRIVESHLLCDTTLKRFQCQDLVSSSYQVAKPCEFVSRRCLPSHARQVVRKNKEFRPVIDYQLCQELECSPQQLKKLRKYQFRFCKWNRLLRKVKILRASGYTVPSMLENQDIFVIGEKKLEEALEKMKSNTNLTCMPTLSTVYISLRTQGPGIDKFIEKAYAGCQKVKPVPIRWGKDVSNCENNVELMKSFGILVTEDELKRYRDILNKVSHRRMTAIISKAKQEDLDFSKLTLKYICNYVLYKEFFPQSRTQLHQLFYDYLKEKRSMDGENGLLDKEVLRHIADNEESVTANLLLLDKEGYTFDEMATCPIVLCHSPAVFNVYYLSNEYVNDVPHLCTSERRKYLLNLLQYMIERNHDFRLRIVTVETHAIFCSALNAHRVKTLIWEKKRQQQEDKRLSKIQDD